MKKHNIKSIVSVLLVSIMILTMLPFFLHFEYRMPTARELVIISVMVALCAAGRCNLPLDAFPL